MKWQEVIHVRASEEAVERLKQILPERCLALNQVRGVEGVELFTCDDSSVDIMMVLRWYVEGRAPEKSRPGCLLAEFLEKYGMVKHAIIRQVFPPQGMQFRGGY